jgi:hypothetical protein
MGEFRFVGVGVLQSMAMGALAKGVTEAAHHLEGAAKAQTRVDTGAERAGIHVEGPMVGGSEATARVATGGASTEYDIYQHEGTYKMSANPFLSGPLIANSGVYGQYIASAAAGVF